MILGVGDRVRRDAEIVGRMKTLDDDTVEKDRDIFHKKRFLRNFLNCKGAFILVKILAYFLISKVQVVLHLILY